MNHNNNPHNQEEIDKFNSMASFWWDTEGSFKTLHHINPLRVDFIQSYTNIQHQDVLDVGCGGGILSEGLANAGANVTAIDMAPESIQVAQAHAQSSKLSIDYQCIEISDFVLQQKTFDSVVCMEMLEHVNDVEYIIANLAKLVKTDGYLFLSTLNRNWKSYVGSVVVAEYVLGLLPRGTHDYAKFIKPHELRKILFKYGFEIVAIKGMDYNPITTKTTLSNDTTINYLLSAVKL